METEIMSPEKLKALTAWFDAEIGTEYEVNPNGDNLHSNPERNWSYVYFHSLTQKEANKLYAKLKELGVKASS